VFYKDSQQFYRVRAFDSFEWLAHGFGTRDAVLPDGLATLRQVHSTRCVAAEGRSGVLGEGDALLENTPGRLVAVKTADCVPMLFADPRNRAVAAVHAGWRGTVGRIGPTAVRAMCERFGTRSEELQVAIGPAIGGCCYEVGPEVAAQFGVAARGHAKIDLPAENRAQLIDAGVNPERVYVANLCTKCGVEFHSFRRHGEKAGRMYSFIGLR
jgi:YfiH family protein